MINSDLNAVAEVTEALYRAEAGQMHQLLAEENRLREALAWLDAQYASNRSLPEADLGGLRQIGGDMIWQGWMGRKRAELQSELARVLGRKGQRVGKLRRAFGKAQAVERMISAERAQHVSDARAQDEATRAQLVLLDRWLAD